MSRRPPSNPAFLPLCLALLLIAARPLKAQDAAAPDYERPAEVAALEKLIADLPAPADTPPLTAADWLELSRLLGSPCDQVRWLEAKAAALADDPAQHDEAARLTQLAQTRIAALTQLALLDNCTAVAALTELAARLATPDAIVDPAALRNLFEKGANLTDLPAPTRFLLLARGGNAKQLLPRNATDAWDVPRQVVDRLGARPELPSVWELLRLRRHLATSYTDWQAANAAAQADASAQAAQRAAFLIAAALLDRALGLDVAGDSLPAAAQPIAYPTESDDRRRLADTLDAAAIRTWASLAHILAAATASTDPDIAAAGAAAQRPWTDVRAINAALWPALDDAQAGWLPRLQNPAARNDPRGLPLAKLFRAAARDQRAALDQRVKTLFSVSPVNADEVFQTIQKAKAADLGLTTTPLTLADLKTELGETQLVYLFLETLQLPGEPGKPPTWCGVCMYRKLYQEKIATLTYTDEYLAKAIPPQASFDDLVKAALADPGPPLRENGQIQKDSRIVLALDGPPAAAWFDSERTTLFQATEWAIKPSWVVYIPSAAALRSDQWTLDTTLRAWTRSALQAALPTPSVGLAPQLLASRGAGPPLERPEMSLYAVSLDDRPPGPESKLADLMTAKRKARSGALALWVSK